MNTVKDRLVNICVSRCMFRDEAEMVVNSAIPVINEAVIGYQIDWKAEEHAYNDTIYGMLMLYVKQEAYKFLLIHHPRAWFINMFRVDGLFPEELIDPDECVSLDELEEGDITEELEECDIEDEFD